VKVHSSPPGQWAMGGIGVDLDARLAMDSFRNTARLVDLHRVLCTGKYVNLKMMKGLPQSIERVTALTLGATTEN